MIKLKKRNAVPAKLQSKHVVIALKALRSLVKRKETTSEGHFNKSIWLDDATRLALWEDQFKKCCYCEKPIELKRASDVEHYRPKGRVHEAPRHPGYWWLAYSWSNLLYACKHCNSEFKKDRFPLGDELKRVFEEGGDLTSERPLILNPYFDDPTQLFAYEIKNDDQYVYILPTGDDCTERSSSTINTCGLNRPDLLERRAEKVSAIRTAIRALHAAIHFDKPDLKKIAKQDLKRLIDPKQSFSGFARYLVQQAKLEEHLN